MEVDCGSARDRLGRRLGERYLLTEVLGAGGTAVVYRASVSPAADGVDYDDVAIKILHDHLSRSDEVCRRFLREGQLGNVLDHPGVVRVLDHGTTSEGCPFLVLELLEGESVEDYRVRSGGRLQLGETLALCDQLLAVLEVAHAKNIVHRDIKPSNLFLTKDGTLKVLDFGIARLVDDTSATSTKTGQMVGTPAFMPPEQALSRPRDVDARTDLWSVGATLFTLLSGEHVHIAETSSEHLVKAATLHARSLARALPGVPSNVESLVARCLAFDKAQRWTSAASMRAELAFVRDEPGRRIGTSTSPPPERTPGDPNTATIVSGQRSALLAATIQDRPERTSDAAMAMSALDPQRPNGRWLLPLAIGSTSLLVVMGIVVFILAVRTTAPASAAAAAAPPAPPATTAVTTATTAEAIPEPKTDEPKTGEPKTETKAAEAKVATPVAAAKPSAAAAPKAPAPAKRVDRRGSTSNKDVYRPF